MQLELRRVAPIRAANIVSLLYGSFMLVFAVPMFIVFSFIPVPVAADSEQQQLALSAFRWILVAYPIMGLFFGWFGGLTSAWLYNLIASWTGGLQFDYTGASDLTDVPAA